MDCIFLFIYFSLYIVSHNSGKFLVGREVDWELNGSNYSSIGYEELINGLISDSTANLDDDLENKGERAGKYPPTYFILRSRATHEGLYADASNRKTHSLQLVPKKYFASVSTGEEKPFDFLRTIFEGFIAGGTAGVVVETALYPIDTIKTRLQAARGGGQIVLKGLYSGLAGNLVGVLPASALFVGVYEPTKQKLLKIFPENLSAVAHLTAGAVGGIAASLIRVPTEVVKQRMQTGQFASAPDAVRLIVSKEGFKGLYAGYGSFLLRDLPFDAIQFCLYEQLRIGYKLAAKRDLNDPENAIIGAFAGALTGAITTPLDVIKTRLMVQGSANQYKGILDCVQTIVREEGPPALLKGIGPRVMWIGIGGSIFFGVLERTKRILAERHPPSNQSIDNPKKD